MEKTEAKRKFGKIYSERSGMKMVNHKENAK